MRKIWIPFIVSTLSIILLFLVAGNLEIFFTDLLNKVVQQKMYYTCASAFILASDVLLPVPSSVVMFMNGFVLGKTYGTLLSLLSVLVGATVGYYLGRFTSVGAKARVDNKANVLIEKYGPLAILLTRGIPILAESVCIVCGYNKMRFRSYLIYNTLGYFPVCALYAICGSFGYDKSVFLLAFGCSIIISLAFWFLGKKYVVLNPAKTNGM